MIASGFITLGKRIKNQKVKKSGGPEQHPEIFDNSVRWFGIPRA